MNFLYPVEDYGVAISVAAEQSFKGNRCMTPVSHQFGISSCVPFVVCDAVSAVSALEVPGHLPWNAIPLSKQELMDCVPVEEDGVHFEHVYDYVRQRGLHSEFNYPYRAQYRLPCLCFPLLEKHKVGILGYEPLLSDAAVIDALHNAPVTATICVYESFLNRGRTMDVYTNLEGEQPRLNALGRALTHAVLIIGHGMYQDKKYYIIKNSMGIQWGLNGYTRVSPHMLFHFICPRYCNAVVV